MIVSGELDHLPEQAFYMVGNIDGAIEKAKKRCNNGPPRVMQASGNISSRPSQWL